MRWLRERNDVILLLSLFWVMVVVEVEEGIIAQPSLSLSSRPFFPVGRGRGPCSPVWIISFHLDCGTRS
jgi:hypothetical protein